MGGGVRRVRGGAIPVERRGFEPGLADREGLLSGEKERIAKAALVLAAALASGSAFEARRAAVDLLDPQVRELLRVRSAARRRLVAWRVRLATCA
jgi:hypothetical protein